MQVFEYLSSVHSNVQQIAQTSTVACSSSEQIPTSSQTHALEDQFNLPNQCRSSSPDPTKEICASIVAKLLGSGISNSLVSSIWYPFSLRDENVVNNEMLEMILSKDVFSAGWVKVDDVE